MIDRIYNLYNLVFIRLLLVFRRETLFQRINALTWYKNMLAAWTDRLRYNNGDRILELGCATGELSQMLVRRGARVTAVDYSDRMLKRARQNNPDGIRYVNADAAKLPYADNSFDYVIAASLINIVRDPVGVLSEMVRVCRTGGRIAVLAPQLGMTDVKAQRLIRKLNLKGFSRATLLTWHRNAPKLSADDLAASFRAVGVNAQLSTDLDGLVISAAGIKA